jgi:hypothetical protein
MPRHIPLFGKTFIVKRNPWRHPKLYKLFEKGLLKKEPDPWILATPPPWFYDKKALSTAQLQQILKFSKVAHATRKLSLEERITQIKKEAGGKIVTEVKPRPELPRLPTIVSIAQSKGVPIPSELQEALEKLAQAKQTTAGAGGKIAT